MTRLYINVTPDIRALYVRSGPERPSGDKMELDELYRVVGRFNEKFPNELVEISNLIEGSEFEKKPSESSSRELSEIELMRLRAEERRYQRSIENLPSLKSKSKEKSEVKSMSESIAFASHFVLAFASAFLLGYYMGEYVFDFQKDEYKYMVGGACSFLTLILESVLFIIRDQKQNRAPSRKQNIVTSKRE